MHPPISPRQASKALIKPISKALRDAFAREGVIVGPSTGPDLVFCTAGFWQAALALEFETPFVIAPYRQNSGRDLPVHLHMRNAIECIKAIAKVDDWKAQQLAAIAIDVVRKSGLRIDMQAVLFDEALAGSRERILKAAHDPDFPPVQASVAIGAGMLPQPPTNRATHLEMLGPERVMGPGVQGTVAEIVANDPTFLLRRPPRDMREFEAAFLDSVRVYEGKANGAELGLGFCLVQPWVSVGRWKAPNSHHLFLPHLHHHSRYGSDWHMSGIISASYREKDVLTGQPRPLEEVIDAPVPSLPRAEVCPGCLAIFVSESGIAAHRCSDIGPDAAHLVHTLRKRFDKGNVRFSASELITEVQPRQGGHENVGGPDALESYLLRHRATLKLRPFEGTWTLVRKPTIKLAAPTSPAPAKQHLGA